METNGAWSRTSRWAHFTQKIDVKYESSKPYYGYTKFSMVL